MVAVATNSGMNPLQQNAIARSLLLQRQALHSMSLGSFSLAPSQTLNLKMKNVGLLVGLSAIVSCSGTVGATTNLSPQGNQGSKALIQRIQFKDIDGIARINASAFEIDIVNSLNARQRIMYQHAYVDPQLTNGVFEGINALNGDQVVFDNTLKTFNAGFYLDIPLCLYRQGDLAGMVNLQSVLGDAYLEITPAALSTLFFQGDTDFALAKIDTAFATAAPTITSFTVEIIQHYYMAQPYPVDGKPFLSFPEVDCQTVYTIEGAVTSSSDIVAGQEKQISLPNNRNIRRALYTAYNGGILGGTRTQQAFYQPPAAQDYQRVKFLTGAGDYYADMSSTHWYARQLAESSIDMGRGIYHFDFTRAPLSTSIYGTAQAVLVCPSTLSGTPVVGICYESHYIKGASLANVTQ